MYIGHKNEEEIQYLKEHLLNTAELSRSYAKSFNAGDMAYVCGLLHDLGKYSVDFQKRIMGNGKKVDHSTAGAQVAVDRYNNLGKIFAYCISGHHGGILNAGSEIDNGEEATLNGRLKKNVKDYSAYKNEIILPENIVMPKLKKENQVGFIFYTLIKMLYSCLVDADFSDTRDFMNGYRLENNYDTVDQLNQKFYNYIDSFKSKNSEINKKRTEILDICIEKSTWDRGMYTLTVPTGGGKTLSSMAFALSHAKKHNMDRIIYVIPYTSIIEQNAKVFKDILDDDNVLEHHSNFDFNDNEDDIYNRQKISAENWDIPILLTTNVQFFESFFANKSSKTRKIHNMTNSVIILDEAQMLPIEYMKPCLSMISELVSNYKSTVILCSATQPSITKYLPSDIKSLEICNNTKEAYEFFKRTEIYNIGEISEQALILELSQNATFLCIVNTRKDALKVYDKLIEVAKDENIFYLSTLMCPLHRKETIQKIKELLKENKPCKVISTQLIEAGVDVDFPVVYRSMSGLDSIVQSAGRCNREGKQTVGKVFVFEPETGYGNLPNSIKRSIEITKAIFRNFDDVMNLEAIETYFRELYAIQENALDLYEINKRIEYGKSNLDFPFKDIADDFKLISNNTKPIIIPFDENSKKLIESLRYAENYNGILRKLQTYTVNVYDKEYNALFGSNKLEMIKPSVVILSDEAEYDIKKGLNILTESGVGIFI